MPTRPAVKNRASRAWVTRRRAAGAQSQEPVTFSAPAIRSTSADGSIITAFSPSRSWTRTPRAFAQPPQRTMGTPSFAHRLSSVAASGCPAALVLTATSSFISMVASSGWPAAAALSGAAPADLRDATPVARAGPRDATRSRGRDRGAARGRGPQASVDVERRGALRDRPGTPPARQEGPGQGGLATASPGSAVRSPRQALRGLARAPRIGGLPQPGARRRVGLVVIGSPGPAPAGTRRRRPHARTKTPAAAAPCLSVCPLTAPSAR